MIDPDGTRATWLFSVAASSFVTLIEGISAEQWSAAALGDWSVRDLVGHGSRALTTVESYLQTTDDDATDVSDDPVTYFRTLAERGANDNAAIAERGRVAGSALGDDPLGAVRQLAARAIALVEATDPSRRVATPGGNMTLRAYLATRTFELTIHGLDLATALGVDAPRELEAPIAATLELVASILGSRPQASSVLLALAGRRALPDGLRIV